MATTGCELQPSNIPCYLRVLTHERRMTLTVQQMIIGGGLLVLAWAIVAGLMHRGNKGKVPPKRKYRKR
jgi:hypothetical protein